jgi:hypothetical protein
MRRLFHPRRDVSETHILIATDFYLDVESNFPFICEARLSHQRHLKMAFSLQDHFTNLPDEEEEEAYDRRLIVLTDSRIVTSLRKHMMD